MAKKRKHGGVKASPAKTVASKEGFSSPFKELKKMLAQAAKANPKPAVPVQQVAKEPALLVQDLSEELLDDETILRRALEGVRPLNGDRRVRTPIEPPNTHTIVNEDAEVIAQLSDLVSG